MGGLIYVDDGFATKLKRRSTCSITACCMATACSRVSAPTTDAPSNAGAVMLDGTFGLAHPLSPWAGFAVMCGYTVVLIGFAAWRLRRVDA